MTRRPRLLDLFCKAGGCSVGYSRAGFDVIGVDIEPQPRYPFAFWQGDALELLRDVNEMRQFDAIHASPPCQAYSALACLHPDKKHPDLLPPTRDLLTVSGLPFVIENVPGAPMRRDVVLCGTMFPELGLPEYDLRRHRWFELGNGMRLSELARQCQHRGRYKTVGVYGGRGQGGMSREYREKVLSRKRNSEGGKYASINCHTITVTGHAGGTSTRDGIERFNTRERARAMGIDWMRDHEVAQAIPPPYTEFIGRQLMRHIQARA